jgi:hypothetical protein
MPGLFRAYGYTAPGTKVPSYFIDSTAPLNVDDESKDPVLPRDLEKIEPPDKAIDAIVEHLRGAEHPNLVVMVHGFNNPLDDVLKLFAGASRSIATDSAVTDRTGLVCVGYRWPSEGMGWSWPSTLAALPSLPTWLLVPTVLLLVLGGSIISGCPAGGHVALLVGLILFGIVLAGALLRLVVYFRDGFRAATYGAPDLVEIVRQIDRRLHAHDLEDHHHDAAAAKHARDGKSVQLSFIGHSMGALVVTNVIRILSDVFDRRIPKRNLNAGLLDASIHTSLPAEIGNVFTVARFVLVAPDIPAEAILSNRANYLASSLRRFREAYLFSSEGDEVLRQISTMANYFSFPTKSWKFGFRLGNTEILTSNYGVIDTGSRPFLSFLRIGYYKLQDLYQALFRGRKEQAEFETLQTRLAEVVSYFDCTDYVEPNAGGKGVLTFALKTKAHNPDARMSWRSHLHLLYAYFRKTGPDVHSGYFKGPFGEQLIYRLACLGYGGTIAAFGDRDQLSAQCQQKQIRVLLSPVLDAQGTGTRTAEIA